LDNCRVQWCLAVAEPGIVEGFVTYDLEAARAKDYSLDTSSYMQTVYKTDRANFISEAIAVDTPTYAQVAEKTRFNRHDEVVQCRLAGGTSA
jgi:hypothetical protein